MPLEPERFWARGIGFRHHIVGIPEAVIVTLCLVWRFSADVDVPQAAPLTGPHLPDNGLLQGAGFGCLRPCAKPRPVKKEWNNGRRGHHPCVTLI